MAPPTPRSHKTCVVPRTPMIDPGPCSNSPYRMPILNHLPERGLEHRDEHHVITQTISKLSTTFTTIVTLGGGPTDYPGHEVKPNADIYGGSGNESGLTTVQLGAIIGSSIAFILILILTWCCILQARRRLEAGEPAGSVYSLTDSTRTSSSSSDEPEPQPRPRPPPPVRMSRNIPGGPKYPTYRAIPVRNPRTNPSVRRTR